MKADETKIAYCRKLYIEQNGKYHYLIEKSMREAGYSFTTRVYTETAADRDG